MARASRHVVKAHFAGHSNRAKRMLGAHPAHDSTGKVHAPTGAHLADGHAKVHAPFRPYKIPKGMVPKKRVN
jgi:hypothetical protein